MLLENVIYVNNTLIDSYQAEVFEGDELKILLDDKHNKPFVEKVNIFFHPPRLVLFHKPKGYVVSKDDPHNKTIYELLPDSRHDDFYYIWRLDKQSTWLLLLTNEPRLVDHYENPEHDINKVYKVRIDRPLRTKDVKKAKKGVRLTRDWKLPEEWEDAELLSCASIRYERDEYWKFWLIIVLKEWKNQHIRRLLWHLGYKIFELTRIKVWKRKLANIKPWERKMEKKLK